MQNINGNFIMSGCDDNSPNRIHGKDGLIAFLNEYGFLPLFSNEIPGFSVEERVPSEVWWTKDPETDPWKWREALASHPDIAYGKFFHGTAGFISRSFFPVFANYRRNGYDYDALYDVGLASHRTKKIMDALFLTDNGLSTPIPSSDLKEKAGFYKGGEQNFNGTLTDLQMMTYLIVTDFGQRKNRWHFALMATPETKWGYDFVTSKYDEDPKESWEYIKAAALRISPNAAQGSIEKMLAIRHGGTEKIIVPVKAKKEQKIQKPKRKQQLPWPENLIRDIGLERIFEDGVYRELTEDQMKGLEFALSTIKPGDKAMVELRYNKHKSLAEIGGIHGMTKAMVRQACARAVSRLRLDTTLRYIKLGYEGVLRMEEEKRREAALEKAPDEIEAMLYEISVCNCGLNFRAERCLVMAGLTTLGAVLKAARERPRDLIRIRNLGKKTLEEIVGKLKEYGVDVYFCGKKVN